MQIQVIGLNLAVRFEPLGFKNVEEAECQRRGKMCLPLCDEKSYQDYQDRLHATWAEMRGRRYLRERERR